MSFKRSETRMTPSRVISSFNKAVSASIFLNFAVVFVSESHLRLLSDDRLVIASLT